MNKNILIVIQSNNDITSNFKQNLELNSYTPYFYPTQNLKLYEPNLMDKLINIIISFFYPSFNFFQFKKKYRLKKFDQKQKKILKQYQNGFFDRTIVFRADLIPDELINIFKNKSKKIIGYQWDGLNRYPEIKNKIQFFDKFYCFDPKDQDKNTKFISNFYFDSFDTSNPTNIWDLTYIGYYTKERFDLLEKISTNFPNLKFKFELLSYNYKEINQIKNSNYVQYIDKIYTYTEQLEIHKNSKAILDIKAEMHNGLSLRFFEALQFKRKLITTNSDVSQYDFYNDINILILDDQNFKNIEEFIDKPCKKIPLNIIEQYSFTSWFKKIINF